MGQEQGQEREIPKLTMGEIIDALKKNIFLPPFEDELSIKCRQREMGIKNCIDLCCEIMRQLAIKPGLNSNKLPFWKKQNAETCILNLINYVQYLISELDVTKIKVYCLNKHSFLTIQPFEPDYTFLMFNSYQGAILTDLYWIEDMLVIDCIEIYKGTFDLEKLNKYLPERIRQLKEILRSNKKVLTNYKSHITTVNEALECYDKNLLKACNLLILTSIEGITRQLGKYLVQQQKLNVNPDDSSYNSLDNFLRKIPWKEDFVIPAIRLPFFTNHDNQIGAYVTRKASDSFAKINISLKTRLDFLRRRFKESRDLILHGQEVEYGKPYHAYINFSALVQVFDAVIESYKTYNVKWQGE